MSTICVKLLKQLFAVCMPVRRTNTPVIQFALDREVGFKLSYKSYFIGGMYGTVIGYSRKQIHYFKKSRATCMFGDYNPQELLLFFIFLFIRMCSVHGKRMTLVAFQLSASMDKEK